MPINPEEVEALIRHQVYIDRFGAGLANRVISLTDDKELYSLVSSKRLLKKKITNFLNREKKKIKKFVGSEIKEMARLELAFSKQLALNFKDVSLGSKQITKFIQEVLEAPLVATNNTIENLYEMAFDRKEQISTSLNSLAANGIKDATTARLEFLAMASQFANTMTMANKTFSFGVSSKIREEAYQQSEAVDRVVMAATLDGRTTVFCMNIDGEMFKKNEGPRPPFHPRCRTVAVPVTEGMNEEDVERLLSFRPSLSPGENYKKGGDKKLRSHKAQIKSKKVKVKSNVTESKSSSSYPNFLASQTRSKVGKEFIRDRIGIRKGNRFIRLVEQGGNPDKILNDLSYDVKAKDLDLNGLKKRLNK